MIDINYFANKAATNGRPAAATPDAHAPNEAELALTFRGIVYPWHLDHMQHMNVQHYVGMFDQSSWILLALIGLDARYFLENRRGMAALEQNIQYKCELHAGDMFEIRSAVVTVREKTIRLQHNMYKVSSGTLAASTSILGVQIDTRTRKSTPLPEGVRERALALSAPIAATMAASGNQPDRRPSCVAQ